MTVLLDEPMKNHTTFRIGGLADALAMPQNKAEMLRTLQLCRARGVPFFILGNGSNLLVRDGGIRGVVIKTCDLNAVEINGETVTAEAGMLLSALAAKVGEAELADFEFAAGIPGSLGGAIFMNAGAYGGEMKDVIEEVECVDKDGNLLTLSNGGMKFSYRHSAAESGELIVLSAKLKLRHGNRDEIFAKIRDYNSRRREKQPLEMPSAGSTFKRPIGSYAGRLIMDSGLAGFFVGGAMVSPKHCGFVVNKGGATAADVLDLIEHIRRVVNENYGILLEPEIKVIGE